LLNGVQKYKKDMEVKKISEKTFLFSNYFSNFASDFEKIQTINTL